MFIAKSHGMAHKTLVKLSFILVLFPSHTLSLYVFTFSHTLFSLITLVLSLSWFLKRQEHCSQLPKKLKSNTKTV